MPLQFVVFEQVEIMQVDVHLFGALRDCLPPELRGKTTLELSSGALVQDVLDMLEIDHAVIVAINDEHDGDTSTRLESGDKVMVFEVTAGG